MHSNIKRFKNCHVGERVIIVCNGPSLNKMDLSFLQHEIVFGLNKIFLGFEKFAFSPQYYVAINELVLRQSEKEIKNLDAIKFIGNRAEDIFESDESTFVINTLKPYGRFCEDIERGVNEGWTVTYAALQIAFYMGFDTVVIIGMDHSYKFEGKPNEARVLIGQDENHFCGSYFGGGQKWHNPDLVKSEESYELAKLNFEKAGRKIFDATIDGACAIFKKIDYETL